MRASGLGELFDDALRWKSRVIDGIHLPTYGRSHLGTSIHYATGWFDNERVQPDGNPDTETAVEKFLEWFRADQGVRWVDIGKAKAEPIGIALVAKYCQDISPQFTFTKVEIPCEPLEIAMPNGIIFQITGTVDRVYERDGKFGIVDLKSGSGVIKADGSIDVGKHGAQLGVYELLEIMARDATGLDITAPAYIIGLSTSAGHEIKFEPIENPRTLLFGDGDEMGYLMAASKIIEHQLYIGNPRSLLCSEKFCGIHERCFYRRGTR